MALVEKLSDQRDGPGDEPGLKLRKDFALEPLAGSDDAPPPFTDDEPPKQRSRPSRQFLENSPRSNSRSLTPPSPRSRTPDVTAPGKSDPPRSLYHRIARALSSTDPDDSEAPDESDVRNSRNISSNLDDPSINGSPNINGNASIGTHSDHQVQASARTLAVPKLDDNDADDEGDEGVEHVGRSLQRISLNGRAASSRSRSPRTPLEANNADNSGTTSNSNSTGKGRKRDMWRRGFNSELPGLSPGAVKTPTPSKNPRRRLRKMRSKSDAEFIDTTSSPRLRPILSSDIVHSDGELDHDIRLDEEPEPAATEPPKRRSKFIPYSRVQGSEPSSSNIKRRISQFNPDVLSGGLSSLNFKNIRMNFSRKKKDMGKPEEYQKSAELVSELASAAPAAVIMASSFQRDDRNLRRVTVLLEQLRFTLSEVSDKKFRLDLEYGNGPASVSWSLTKDYKDFMVLHARLKAMNFQTSMFNGARTAQRHKFPKFPKSHHFAAPNGRRNSSKVAHPTGASPDAGVPNGGAHPNPAFLVTDLTTQPSINSSNRSATPTPAALGAPAVSIHTGGGDRPVSLYSMSSASSQGSGRRSSRVQHPRYDNLCAALTAYLSHLLTIFRFRADVNKLLQFLELSNMSIRLAPEHAYHGKEGMLFVRSFASEQGWRVSHWKPEDLSQMISRHTHKWFMVRHSYIVCVDNITATNVLEVFVVDSGFRAYQNVASASHAEGLSDGQHSGDAQEGHHDGHKLMEKSGASRFFLVIENNERKLKMASKSEKEISNWVESINLMKEQCIWSKQHRFDSFAPVRHNVHAQWFVDGRDYFWTVSEAISMARDVIYIHDWWLSPELYLRRPAQGNQQWRIDRLLKRKAEEGVKIFIIVYRNVGQTVPIDSFYSKHSLLDLHDNIYVMRSPNQWLQNTYFWAHHEKLCMVDHTVGFVGGIDMCFGRWDTPDHVLVDDSPEPFYTSVDESRFEPTQMWPGKDYSNPRVQDFYQLDRPYEDMYDRQKVPRMPWHDVHMMVVGQSARDLARHFVQRWNYLIRQKRPSRSTPLLLPPPDYKDEELRQQNLAGTCELQILRSSTSWSLGLKEAEHSIQNAYLKAIESSVHFVYIENQFFITSTTVENTKIENKIGDALVERILRAHKNDENWRAIIVIPLMPGFESQVDLPDGSSVRVIMQCQYMSISRGSNSIFGRLRKHGINPDDYIQFFSLRKWGKIGKSKKLVTEQLYLHGKIMIVDDRTAIIGSANINERSMRGSRDSEVAAIIRDTHQLDSHMAGKPFKVGKFAHTLRVRLMREHLGVDVDQIEIIERHMETMANPGQPSGSSPAGSSQRPPRPQSMASGFGDSEGDGDMEAGRSGAQPFELHSFNHTAGVDNIGMRDNKNFSSDSRVQNNSKHNQDVEGLGQDYMNIAAALEEKRSKKLAEEANSANGNKPFNFLDLEELLDGEATADVVSIKRKLYEKLTQSSLDEDAAQAAEDVASLSDSESMSSAAQVDPYKFADPLDEDFYFDTWLSIAERNTMLFRQVFRCQPDDEVTSWKEYKEYVAFGEKFSNIQDVAANVPVSAPSDTMNAHAPLGTAGMEEQSADEAHDATYDVDPTRTSSQETGTEPSTPRDESKPAHTNGSAKIGHATSSATLNRRRRRARTSRRWYTMLDHVYDAPTAERILQGIKGNLVMFPTDWLAKELETGNWFYNLDLIPPLEIYD